MRHSDLVLLGLLAGGDRHGYELTREIEDMRLRWWAKISQATVYRGLKRLEDQGCLEAEPDREGNRPERTVYRLTPKGEERLEGLVREALASDEPVYSDRLVGAVFSVGALPPARRRQLLDGAVDALRKRERSLRDAREEGASPLGEAVVDFKLAVAEAEMELLRRLREADGDGSAPAAG